MKKLSIIIPVYNVEKYIGPCLNSIFSQGLDEDCFEVIIINDGTKDKSMEVITGFVCQHTNIIIIDQKNQGMSVARNKGMEKAVGDYILFVDSDDLLVERSLPTLLERAILFKADMVVADFKRMDDEEIDCYLRKPSIIQNNCDDIQEKTGWTMFLEDLNPRECYIWRILYRREFLASNNIQYTPGICYEDIPFLHECYLKASKCLRTHQSLYIYRIGHASITKAINKKTGMDFGTAIAKTWELKHLNGLSSEIKERLNDNIFAALSVLLYAIAHDIQHSSDKAAILKHLKEVAPDLHFSHGRKQQFVNFMYQKMPYTYITIRSLYVKIAKRCHRR